VNDPFEHDARTADAYDAVLICRERRWDDGTS
jgi:hypothetical protein